MNLHAHYCLSRDAVIRPERFGGLVYRYDNRRLYFLYSHELVEFVCNMSDERPLGAALDDFLTLRGLPETVRDGFVTALAQLEQLRVLTISEHSESL